MDDPLPSRSYYQRSIPPGPWDDIVIGSGLGGMVAAGIAGRLGRRVLVLEQHTVPGGATQSFQRHQWRWNVGVHVVGLLEPGSVGSMLLRTLCESEPQWASLGEIYDEFHFPGRTVEIPASPEVFERQLAEEFPAESAGLRRYFELVRKVAVLGERLLIWRALPWHGRYTMWPFLAWPVRCWARRTTKDVIEELIGNADLRSILTAQWGYYGSPPARSSFVSHAVVTNHFLHGGFYPHGGGAALGHRLLGSLVKAGGAVCVRTPVKQVVLDGERAVGVELASGRIVHARRVFSDVGALGTCRRLLPDRYQSCRWGKRLTELTSSQGHLSLFLGLEGDPRSVGLNQRNRWYFESWDHDADQPKPLDEFRTPTFWLSMESLKDPTHDPGSPQKHTAQVITFAPWSWFEPFASSRWKKRGASYDEFKEWITRGLLAQVLEHVPELGPLIRHVELSTPLTMRHFTGREEGAVYGVEPTPRRFTTSALHPRTPIKNLFLTGCDVGLMGVVGSMAGGVMAALAAEPLRGSLFLARSMRSEPRK